MSENPTDKESHLSKWERAIKVAPLDLRRRDRGTMMDAQKDRLREIFLAYNHTDEQWLVEQVGAWGESVRAEAALAEREACAQFIFDRFETFDPNGGNHIGRNAVAALRARTATQAEGKVDD